MKVILYFSKNHQQTAFWYAKEFFQQNDNACIIKVSHGPSLKLGENNDCTDELFSFLRTRNINPTQCEFHFILHKKPNNVLCFFSGEGLLINYNALFEEKNRGAVTIYAGVKQIDEKAITSIPIAYKDKNKSFSALEEKHTRKELFLFQEIPQSNNILEFFIEKNIHDEIEDHIQAKITKLSLNVLTESSAVIIDALAALSIALKKDAAKHPSEAIAEWEKDYAELLNEERSMLTSFMGQTNLKKFIELLKRSYPAPSDGPKLKLV